MVKHVDLPTTDQVLDFVELCRDEHIGPYPTSLRVVSNGTGLSTHEVRLAVAELLYDGRLTKMRGFPDYGVVLP